MHVCVWVHMFVGVYTCVDVTDSQTVRTTDLMMKIPFRP